MRFYHHLSRGELIFPSVCFVLALAGVVGLALLGSEVTLLIGIIFPIVFLVNYYDLLREETLFLLSEKRFLFGVIASAIGLLTAGALFILVQKSMGLFLAVALMPSVAIIYSRRPEKYR